MRAFIALKLAEEIKEELKRILQELEKAKIDARWVNPKMTHLTLAFLGSIIPDKIKIISKILEEITHETHSFNLFLSRIDCLPTLYRPRIIFAGLEGDLDKLNILALKIKKLLARERIYFDRRQFFPHITLGRIKRKQNLSNIIKRLKIKKIAFSAKEIALHKSVLTDKGAIHTILYRGFLS